MNDDALQRIAEAAEFEPIAERMCRAEGEASMPSAGYICTRTAGHDGLHVAHGPNLHVCHYWLTDEEQARMDEEEARAAKPVAMNRDEQCCQQPNDGYVCTRPTGHDGIHVAHGPADEVYRWWRTQP